MNFLEYFVGLNLKHFVGNFIGNFWSDISRGIVIVKKMSIFWTKQPNKFFINGIEIFDSVASFPHFYQGSMLQNVSCRILHSTVVS
jgi:hypothetical protein